MPIPLAAQAQVYWRTSQELAQARKDGDTNAVKDALQELLDLGAFTETDVISKRCHARVPIGRTGDRLAELRARK
jgi:hypothetical protein